MGEGGQQGRKVFIEAVPGWCEPAASFLPRERAGEVEGGVYLPRNRDVNSFFLFLKHMLPCADRHPFAFPPAHQAGGQATSGGALTGAAGSRPHPGSVPCGG
jgi:hypothetical protein